MIKGRKRELFLNRESRYRKNFILLLERVEVRQCKVWMDKTSWWEEMQFIGTLIEIFFSQHQPPIHQFRFIYMVFFFPVFLMKIFIFSFVWLNSSIWRWLPKYTIFLLLVRIEDLSIYNIFLSKCFLKNIFNRITY